MARVVLIGVMVALTCWTPFAAHAKTSDRDQPVKVSAKSADALAKPNGVSHLNGDVIITQGTLKATGARATLHFDAHSQVNRVILTGGPAHLRQVDDSGNLIKARAKRIDYNVPQGIAKLVGDACVKQAGRGSACGARLVYNTETSAMKANSKGDQRVHLIFQAKQGGSQGRAPASAATTGGH